MTDELDVFLHRLDNKLWCKALQQLKRKCINFIELYFWIFIYNNIDQV